MHKSYRKVLNLLPFLLLPALSLANPKAQSALEQYEAVAHPNFGCPENSECDAEMGKLLTTWKKVIARWSLSMNRPEIINKEITKATEKLGFPIEFLAKPSIKSTLSPALFDSPCKEHKPKDSTEKLMRGIGFIKGQADGHLIFAKGDTEYRLKLGEVVHLQKVIFFPKDGKPMQVFELPLEEKPLYIEDDQVVTLVESEDLFFLLTINQKGSWSFAIAPTSGISSYHDYQEEVACPKNALPLPTGFTKTYCQNITNKAQQLVGIVQLFWTCN